MLPQKSPLPTDELRLNVPGGGSAFTWHDLYQPARLKDLHERFLIWFKARAPEELAARFDGYRACKGDGMQPQAISNVVVDVAPYVAEFVAHMFGVTEQRAAMMREAASHEQLFRMKDQLVKRRAAKRGDLPFDGELDATARRMLQAGWGIHGAAADDEHQIARAACELLDVEDALKKNVAAAADGLKARLAGVAAAADDKALVQEWLVTLEKWLMMRRRDPRLAGWMAWRLPHHVDYEHLVPISRPNEKLPQLAVGPEHHRRHRDGFRLTDWRMSSLEIADQVDYCLYCHDRDKDSCSKGLRENKTNAIKPNPLGVALNGCPLGEKISEMHLVKKAGDSLASLAIVTIDNPMAPGTGHRICNDCMKACVFQKQEPVNIPQIETGALTDILELPWGFEIYSLMTRWNPLAVRRPYALPYNGKNVLVVGMGPAGYTLAHYLVNEGFGVVGIDGLKIEPLPRDLLTSPIKDVTRIYKELDDKVLYGFGGVSEYGITVRWDKNFLTVLYLALARRDKLKFYGGVRFGGTLTLADAWKYGFDHVAIAAGAGKPTLVDIEHNLIRGIRQASDFLMALQLTGAFKKSTMSNLQVRLPAVVIGGGLTGIDTATELRAYYVVQVEKALEQYELLVKDMGEDALRARHDREELAILEEFLAHGRQVRAERTAAARDGREPNFDDLIELWGGVTLAYRKRMQDSPAYRLNHEEIIKALEEGIRFLEHANPKAAVPDEFGALSALDFTMPDKSVVRLPARTLCVAAGTSPNTIYEKEHPGTFLLDKKSFFQNHVATRGADGKVALAAGEGFFTSYLDAEGRTVSYYGDNHPKYAGSVVKAMASAKDGHPFVAALFQREIDQACADSAGQPAREQAWQALATQLDEEILAVVVAVHRLTPTIVEVVVRAPLQARKFAPGQFYRLQNYETEALAIDGTRLLMEGLALTGAWTDVDKGLLSLIVLEMGGSSRLCAALKPGEHVVVMGPTGTPTEIPHGETVLLAGGGLGNAVLFSIAKALRAAGNQVVYFAGYKQPGDLFKREDIQEGTDQVIWSSDVGPAITPQRPQDRAFVGNIVAAMVAYAEGKLGERLVDLGKVNRVIAIGSDRMMAAVAQARHTVLAPYLQRDHVGIGSINSPMQCMMKEVCAQCLQKHHDPVTGKTWVVFSCFNQDQTLDTVDWKSLNDRLRQNTVQEKLSNLWLDRLLKRRPELLRV